MPRESCLLAARPQGDREAHPGERANVIPMDSRVDPNGGLPHCAFGKRPFSSRTARKALRVSIVRGRQRLSERAETQAISVWC